MLRLRIRADDLSAVWHQLDGEWRAGESFVEPFGHAMVETTSVSGVRGLDLLVREALLPGGDELAVTISSGVLRLRAGRRGTVPLSVVVADGVLYGSWDLSDLYRFAAPDQLGNRAIVRLLTRRQRYSTDTVFRGIARLTERAEATFDQGGLAVRYPPDAVHVLAARSLREGADPIHEFEQMLSRQTEPVVQTRRVGLELSGGLDSANVALAAADRTSSPLDSFGLIGHGPTAAPQRLRRAEIVRELGLTDLALQAATYLPFGRMTSSPPQERHHPDGDVYREAFDELRSRAAAAGCDVMLTGFGGDELMSLRSAERSVPRRVVPLPPWLGERSMEALPAIEDNVAPTSAVAVPCLMASAARHCRYLHRGLWPVAPLADPVLLRFAESLPVEWRIHKRLLRSRLARAGFSREVTHPTIVESFSATMELALRQRGIAMAKRMLDGSFLVDAGYVDRGLLAETLRMVEQGAAVPELLYDTLAVERGLQSAFGAEVTSDDRRH